MGGQWSGCGAVSGQSGPVMTGHLQYDQYQRPYSLETVQSIVKAWGDQVGGTASVRVVVKCLFKSSLGSHVIVFRLQLCLFLPGTSKIYHNQFPEVVNSYIYSE